MRYLVQFKIDRSGSAYDERSFATRLEAEAHFDSLYNLPARDNVWEWIQLWEISETGSGKMLREERGK